jgi:hypothetical protein
MSEDFETRQVFTPGAESRWPVRWWTGKKRRKVEHIMSKYGVGDFTSLLEDLMKEKMVGREGKKGERCHIL